MERDNHYISEVTQDLVTGELLVPIPEQVIIDMGLYEGIEVEWTLDGTSALLTEHETNHD